MESVKKGSSDSLSTIAIGKIAGENTEGVHTKNINVTCLTDNFHLEIGGTVTSRGNTVKDGRAAKCSVAVFETSAYIGLVCAPDSEDIVTKVTHNGETKDGDAAATCHEGFAGGFGT